MGLYHDFSGILSESYGGAAVQRPQKRLMPAQRDPMPGYPMDRGIQWAGAAEHTQKSGFCHIYALIHASDLLLILGSASGLQSLRAPKGKPHC